MCTEVYVDDCCLDDLVGYVDSAGDGNDQTSLCPRVLRRSASLSTELQMTVCRKIV